MRKRKQLDCHISIQYVPLPPEKEAAWWAGMSLLLELLSEQSAVNDSDVNDPIRKTSNSTNILSSTATNQLS